MKWPLFLEIKSYREREFLSEELIPDNYFSFSINEHIFYSFKGILAQRLNLFNLLHTATIIN